MKKSLLLFAFIFFTYVLNAQIEQGKLLFSGGVNFSTDSEKYEMTTGSTTNTTDGPKTTQMGIELGFGYFFTDNLAVGIGLGFDSWKVSEKSGEDQDVEIEESETLTYVAPGLRYYAHVNDELSFFGEFSAAFGFGKEKYEEVDGSTTQTEEQDFNMLRIGITPGFNYMMSNRVGFEINYGFLGYNSYSYENEEGDNKFEYVESGFGLDLDFTSLQFAIVFVL